MYTEFVCTTYPGLCTPRLGQPSASCRNLPPALQPSTGFLFGVGMKGRGVPRGGSRRARRRDVARPPRRVHTVVGERSRGPTGRGEVVEAQFDHCRKISTLVMLSPVPVRAQTLWNFLGRHTL
eukprot:366265-Chlamydomonas_euryale.AAC.2